MSSSNWRQASGAHELKQRVLTCLDRLGDRDTLAQATTELDLLSRSLSPGTSFAVFLSCLLSVDSSHRAAVRAHSLRLIASLAASHPLHLAPHLPKILSSSLLRRIRDPDSSVRSACSAASSSLARHVSSSPFRLILDPLLAALLVEQDLNVQIGSAVCLSAAIESSEIVEAGELRRVLPKMVKLARSDGFKAKPALLGLIGSVVAADGGGVVNGPALMGNVVSCTTELLSSEDWAARKAAAEALEKVAVAVAQRELVAEVKILCVNSLENRRFDKVKIARVSMNRALEAWKEVNESSGENSPSKDTNNGKCSPPLSKYLRQFSFETPQPKKKLIKTRSSLSDCSTVTSSSLVSKSSSYVGSETPQLEKALFKSRSSMSSLSDDSSLTVAKKTSPQIPVHKKSRSRPARKSDARKPSDWRVDIRVPQEAPDSPSAIPAEVISEHRNSEVVDSCEYNPSNIGSSTKTASVKRMYEEQVHKSSTRSSVSQVVPLQDVDDSDQSDVVDVEEVDDNSAEYEDLSRITKQRIQIEKQQSNLMQLLQTFMGASQNGINSLETRVSGLEKALDGIYHGLGVQNGRMLNESAGSSCWMIPGAEFLSPKFWRRNEGGPFVASNPCGSQSMHHKDLHFNTGEMEVVSQPGLSRNSTRNLEVNSSTRTVGKTSYEVSQRRACSGGDLDGISSRRTCITPVAQRTL